jgi:fumarate reductase flavoprotein subunit
MKIGSKTIGFALLTAGMVLVGGTVFAQQAPVLDSSISGTATATAQGFGGDVTVTLTVASGKITEAVVEGPSETAEIGGAVISAVAAQITGRNSCEIDMVAGATITSTAVKTAALECLNKIVNG